METMDFEEKIPFLEDDRDEPQPLDDQDTQKSSHVVARLRRRLSLSMIANAVLLGLSISLTLILIVLVLSRAQNPEVISNPYCKLLRQNAVPRTR